MNEYKSPIGKTRVFPYAFLLLRINKVLRKQLAIVFREDYFAFVSKGMKGLK